MRAAVYHGPHDVRIEQVAEPAPPGPGEVVLEVLRASICGTDASEWAHGPLLVALNRPHPVTGRCGPVVLGHEFVGRVAAVGEGVEGVALGDRVVSGAGVSCGACEWCRRGRTNLCARYYTLGLHADGGLAEQVATPAGICRRVPDALSDDAASLAQPLAVALHAVDRGGAGAGETVAVIGAGGIGAFVIAAVCGRPVERVIAIDIDEARLETARRIGAHEAIDARGRDLAALLLEATGGEGAHVVIEASGAPHAPAAALAGARRGGRVVLVGLQAAPRELDVFAFTVREVDVITTLAHVCASDLPAALELLARSRLASTVSDRLIPLDALVEEGLRPLAEHTARGKILIDPRA